MIGRRNTQHLREKTTSICCNLRGYFLFHVVTMKQRIPVITYHYMEGIVESNLFVPCVRSSAVGRGEEEEAVGGGWIIFRKLLYESLRKLLWLLEVVKSVSFPLPHIGCIIPRMFCKTERSREVVAGVKPNWKIDYYPKIRKNSFSSLSHLPHSQTPPRYSLELFQARAAAHYTRELLMIVHMKN